MRYKTISDLRDWLLKQRQKGTTYRSLCCKFLGVKPGTLCRIVNDSGYEPKDKLLRQRLGLPALPVLALTPVCRKCGRPEPSKRCTHKPTTEERYSINSVALDKWRAKHAAEIRKIVDWATSLNTA
jgi:hypothetical protein